MIDYIRLNSFGIKRIFYFDTVDSTNLYAKKENPDDDTLILAGYQAAGKGRFDRKWDAEKYKNITVSIVKSFDIPDMHLVNFYTSYVLFKTLKEILQGRVILPGKQLALKWPNDIMLGGRKLSGILSELLDFNQKPKKFIIGIGVNVNQEVFPEQLADKATSLKLAYGSEFDTSEIITLFIKNFYESIPLISRPDVLMELWRLNTDTINKNIRFRMNDNSVEMEGTVLNIQDDGGIIIKMTGKDGKEIITVFYSGEISFIY
jgi:BirA family transcriptional regulator, biotin operon repressor / biotin---[acetyl-CoA-carboxylase] ligase